MLNGLPRIQTKRMATLAALAVAGTGLTVATLTAAPAGVGTTEAKCMVDSPVLLAAPAHHAHHAPRYRCAADPHLRGPHTPGNTRPVPQRCGRAPTAIDSQETSPSYRELLPHRSITPANAPAILRRLPCLDATTWRRYARSCAPRTSTESSRASPTAHPGSRRCATRPRRNGPRWPPACVLAAPGLRDPPCSRATRASCPGLKGPFRASTSPVPHRRRPRHPPSSPALVTRPRAARGRLRVCRVRS